MTLDQAKMGKRFRIIYVHGQGVIRRRLLDLGLTPKTIVEVRKVAPMGDPIELFVRSYVLSLRKNEAACIEIEEVLA